MTSAELKGKTIYSKYLVNLGNFTHVPKDASLPVNVVSIDTDKNELIVDWGSGAGDESWDLQHTLWAFERGEYSFKPFNK